LRDKNQLGALPTTSTRGGASNVKNVNYIDHMCKMFHWQLTYINSPDDFWDACILSDLRSKE
jgi:hypothetical protein